MWPFQNVVEDDKVLYKMGKTNRQHERQKKTTKKILGATGELSGKEFTIERWPENWSLCFKRCVSSQGYTPLLYINFN